MNFSQFYECGIENPHNLSSPCWRIDCGDFFVLGCVDANIVFSVCIYKFQNGWDFKGMADFVSLRDGKCWIRLREIRLFGYRWCGAAERILREILVAEQYHRGSKMVYHTPVPPQRYKQKCFRGCYSISKCSALFFPKKLRSSTIETVPSLRRSST